MAKDILDAIRQAELNAAEREALARDSAQKKINDAHAKAKQLINDAELKADADAAKRYESAGIDGENELIKARKSADSKCESIKAAADKNRDNVIKSTVDFILN